MPQPEGFDAGELGDFVVVAVVGVVDELVVGFGLDELEVEVEVLAPPVDVLVVEVVAVVLDGHDCDRLVRVAVQVTVEPFATAANAITVTTEATAARATDSSRWLNATGLFLR